MRIFVDTDKFILKFIWKATGARITKTTLEKKNKMREIALHDIKTCYITTVIQTVWGGINT